jgi:hypothetical protein
MTHKLSRTLCALALVCSSHGHAAVTASAHVTGLVFSVVDLRPEDGAAPSLSFGDDRSFLQGTAESSGLPGRDANLRGTEAFADLSASITVGTVRTSAFIDGGEGGAPWSGSVLHADGHIADAANRTRAFSSSVLSHSASPGVPNLFLSPHTQLEVSITAELFAAKTVGPFVEGDEYEVSVASASLRLSGPGFDNSRSAWINLSLYDPAQSQSRTVTFSAFARNNTDQPMPLLFYARAAADGRSTVSVVPEPATWALWAAGLGALVWRQRRPTPQRG